ncbi:RWP-RK domain-containing protein, partial [Ochromonadaceae sp. CCMP2298]
RNYFHLPIVEVAKQLGTCTTALKKICRKNKISKWPYRQIRSITKSIQSLEMASLNDTLNEELRIQYRQQIVTLQTAIDSLIRDPN